MVSTRSYALSLSVYCVTFRGSGSSTVAFLLPQRQLLVSIVTTSPTSLQSSRRQFPDGRGSFDYDPFSPQQNNNNNLPPPPGPRRSFGEPSIDLNGQIQSDRQSNLAYNSRRTPSVNEDPRGFDMDRRFSQRPDVVANNDNGSSMQPRRSWWESPSPYNNDRIQGGSRHTYHAPHHRDASHIFLESDGRPIDVELELWDGPNNTPTKLKVYSEDGRMRPINAMVENPMRNMRDNTLSVRNTGPMEFPISGGVSNMRMMGGGPGQDGFGGLLAGDERAAYDVNSLASIGPFTRPSSPSMKRGERVQGGALRTFPLDYSVEAVQVTITTQGLPMMAKVELWGTSSHIKQIAEIYNDNGQTRPFAAILDVPGGSNTVAIYNTGPMEYPIEVVVEPIARMEGWDGREDERVGGSLAPWNDGRRDNNYGPPWR